jgi:hypothetical protein
MARNDDVALTRGTWAQLTNANAAALRVANISGYGLTLQATAGATAPESRAGSLVLGALQVLAADLTIAQLWPGVAGANRVWAMPDIDCTVSVSHADA